VIPPADASRSGVEDTRVRILAAARTLYASKGSRGTTTREVADRANVNEATLFRHFGTKTHLISAMLEHYSTNESMPEVLARVAALPAIEEQLCVLAHGAIDQIRARADLIRVSMAEEAANPEGLARTWRAPNETMAMLIDWFDGRTRAGVLDGDPASLARVFLSLFFSFVMARRIWGDVDGPQERSVDNLVHIFLNGARAR
jgi:AcrR family transcriptional regulator